MLSSQTLSDLTNEYEDIMKPHFSSSKFLLFKYYSPRYEGIRFRGSIYQNLHGATGSTVNGGSCSLHYERGIVQVKNKIRTDGEIDLALDFDLNKYAKDLSSQLKIKTNHLEKEYSGKLKFLWYKNRYSIKSTFDWSDHKCFSSKIMGLVFNEPNRQLGLGTGLAFAFEDKQFSIYNLTLWYVRNYAKFVLTHKSKRNKLGLGQLSGKIYNRVDDKTDVALGFKHSFTGSQDQIALGLRYKHSDTFSLKTKIDSSLNMKAAFQLYFDKNLQLVITSNHNVAESIDLAHKNVHADHTPPISLKISFGEI